MGASMTTAELLRDAGEKGHAVAIWTVAQIMGEETDDEPATGGLVASLSNEGVEIENPQKRMIEFVPFSDIAEVEVEAA
jgi:hypothetical protein